MHIVLWLTAEKSEIWLFLSPAHVAEWLNHSGAMCSIERDELSGRGSMWESFKNYYWQTTEKV